MTARDVAVKVLSKDLAAKPAFVQRFLRAARVMARLDGGPRRPYLKPCRLDGTAVRP